ncbi:MAG: hypothetical protein CO114_01285 [Euryarchaeota archaeon CG_4_9_14_3_um_filter_38_12]|nr:MAG: hypothetical protein CO114_01285 [Euryarchaeota archaeon CG_4_9_14_3_um_filter_38_12]
MKKAILILLGGLLICPSLIFAEWVNGYYRKNGTYVSGYYRSPKNSSVYDNHSYSEKYKSPVKVEKYQKKNYTEVESYYRSRPNAYKYDNYSYKEKEPLFNKSYSNPDKNYGSEWYTPVTSYEKNIYYQKDTYDTNDSLNSLPSKTYNYDTLFDNNSSNIFDSDYKYYFDFNE